ncbi:MAG: acylphosphatase [Bacteroidetes bacterium]|nr:MAG: acylphosphatase [Bacteroidota bacterium]
MQTLSYRIIVTGRVQQVGFRFFTQQKAVELEITGSVQNLPNGDVMIIAYGAEKNMLQFINLLQKGPSRSLVTNIDLQEIPFEALKSFRIVRL